jgi:hypothetical protein
MAYFIKAKIEGRGPLTCLDLPEEIWRAIPACDAD